MWLKCCKSMEHDLQVGCVRWFRLAYPSLGRLLFAIPNGGQRNVIVARKLKAEGVVAGIPDLFLAVKRGGYGGLFIEMKNGSKGKLSEAQKTMCDLLQTAGYKIAVCRSFEEFEHTIKLYFEL